MRNVPTWVLVVFALTFPPAALLLWIADKTSSPESWQ